MLIKMYFNVEDLTESELVELDGVVYREMRNRCLLSAGVIEERKTMALAKEAADRAAQKARPAVLILDEEEMALLRGGAKITAIKNLRDRYTRDLTKAVPGLKECVDACDRYIAEFTAAGGVVAKLVSR